MSKIVCLQTVKLSPIYTGPLTQIPIQIRVTWIRVNMLIAYVTHLQMWVEPRLESGLGCGM